MFSEFGPSEINEDQKDLADLLSYDIRGHNKITSIQHLPEYCNRVVSWTWEEVFSTEQNDRQDHFIRYVQICRMDAIGADRFLQVKPKGKDSCEVNMCGKVRDMPTLFTIRQWMDRKHVQVSQLICSGGPCKDYILYIEDGVLKAKPDDEDIRSESPDQFTLFRMAWNLSETQFSLQLFADDKHFLSVDQNGNFIPLNGYTGKQLTKRQYFRPIIIKRITAV